MSHLERLIEVAQKARDVFRAYATHHIAKADLNKAQRNTDLADALDCALSPFVGGVDAYFAAQEKSRLALFDKAVADLKEWKAMQRENHRIAQEHTP